MIKPVKIETHKDLIAEKIDEMADLGEHWKRNRKKGRNPNAIRSAMLMLADEIKSLITEKDAVYEGITIFVLRMRHELYTGGGMDRDAFDNMYLGGIGEYEKKLAEQEGIEIDP